MAEVALKVEKRESGRKTAKELRLSGKVPGVYYVKGQTGIPITADPMSLRPIVYTAQTKLVKLDIDGEIKSCVLKDITFHPITEQITHFDLLGLLDDNKVTVPVPFKFIGQSKGVMNGGLFRPVLNKTRISCYPKDLPEFLEIKINDLEIGKVIRLAKIKSDYPNIDFAVKENPVVCSVARPRVKTV